MRGLPRGLQISLEAASHVGYFSPIGFYDRLRTRNVMLPRRGRREPPCKKFANNRVGQSIHGEKLLFFKKFCDISKIIADILHGRLPKAAGSRFANMIFCAVKGLLLTDDALRADG